MKKDAETVHPDHAEKTLSGIGGLNERGDDGCQRTQEGEDSEWPAVLVWVHKRLQDYDQQAKAGEHQLGKDADVIGGRWRHGVAFAREEPAGAKVSSISEARHGA